MRIEKIKVFNRRDDRFKRFLMLVGIAFAFLALMGVISQWVSRHEKAIPTVLCNAEEELVYRKKKNDKMQIALTFDDGPHPYYTPIILDILEEYGVSATFFTVGENIEYYPATAERLLSSGHEVENHTYTHAKMGKMGYVDIVKEIERCEDAVAAVSERKTRFLRPPQGEMSDTVKDATRRLDYRLVLWDVDTRDWAHTSPEDIKNNVLDVVTSGDIILMHDFIGHNSPTPAALRLLIPELLERGYKFVKVAELIDGNP